MNGYRGLADFTHLFAFCLLIVHIIKTRSCSSLSGKTQILLAVVFITRYSDLLTTYISFYNTSMKILYITAAIATSCLICFLFKTKYEAKHDKIRLECLLVPPALIALAINSYPTTMDSMLEMLWTFSIFLEAVAILPQLYLVLKKGEADMIIAYYVAALALYRSLYIVNWYERYVNEGHVDMISTAGGTVQVIIYSMFLLLPITYITAGEKSAESIFTISNITSEKQLPFSIYKENILIAPLAIQKDTTLPQTQDKL